MARILSGWKYIALVLGLAVLAFLIMDFNSRMTEWRRLSVQREEVSVQATGMMETQQAYQTRIAYATSPAGVVQWAYEDGHWVRSGEYLVVPLSSNQATPVPTPTPVATPRPVENW